MEEIKNDICPDWREYDDEAGTYEYCKKHKCVCSCCGSLERCLKGVNKHLELANNLLKDLCAINLIGRR